MSYKGSDEGVTVYLDISSLNSGGWAEGDILVNIEGIISSDNDDSLYGSTFFDSTLYGLGGDDKLEGIGMDDILVGGAGNDRLSLNDYGNEIVRYESYSEVEAYTDTIIGFNSGKDRLEFDSTAFKCGSAVDFSEFFTSFTSLENANRSSACFIYESCTLYYDEDGTGGAAAVPVAIFSDNADIDFSDIHMI